MYTGNIRRLTIGATALLAVPTLLTATAPVASAHYNYAYQGKDFISVSDTHTSGSVCDREVDGNAVYAMWTQGPDRKPIVEWDGGDRGCDTAQFPVGAIYMKLCENTNHGTGADTCTGWIHV
ncbi:hypothetical protein E0H73_09070 [Kribbella pittospori]|uniref:Secreted protein n=1 Tax=Kribbella pittospori TaxID=722689 RepID=A0A4R0KYR5_9ACTN|nr:hypothetical protein [Kribbella pittospori]TCC64526.1 hypothetical protein E0H73_09070 [Kribbella pittospori]